MTRSWIADVSTAAASSRSAEATGARLALTIVSHPVGHRVGDRLLLDALAAGREASVSRNAPDFVRPGHVIGMPLGDPFVSRRPIRITAAAAGGARVVAAAGTAIVCGARSGEVLELTGEAIAAGAPLELADRVVVLLHLVDPAGGDTEDALGMIGDGTGIRRVRTEIARVVDLVVPVLIRGETGTGKELVARAIHDHSPRRAGPFVSVNLGAVPRELAAADLFGAVRGAYTGATRDREGYFRAAHGGTLFLDELGEAPPEVQVMLLRVLETGELYPVGAEKPVATDVRVIAATDGNLEEQIRLGRFKAPLLHRLAGYEVRIPALRERRDDIGRLFYHFAREELAAVGELERLAPQDPYAKPWLPASIAARLVRYAWPGNIRQLRNLTRQLVIGSRGLPQIRLDPRLAAELAALEVHAPAAAEPAAAPPAALPRRKAGEISEPELLDALRACAWDLKAAADRLRISRPSIYDLIDKSPDLRTAGDLGAAEITACFHDCGGELDAMITRLQVSKRALARRLRELGLVGQTGGRGGGS